MNVLIVYADRLKGDLLSLASLLYLKEVQFVPQALEPDWTLADAGPQAEALSQATHIALLLDPSDLRLAPVSFLTGFAAGRSEISFLYTRPAQGFPAWMESRFRLCPDLPTLAEALSEEKDRYDREQARQKALADLVDRDRDPTARGFLEAVSEGDTGSVALYLQAGFDPNSCDRSGVPLVNLALRRGHGQVLEALVAGGADINRPSRDRGYTALMEAASQGQADYVEKLLAWGADVKPQCKNGQSALILAVGRGDGALALRLLKAGADPFVEDQLGMSAFKYAQLFSREDLLAAMRRPA